MLGRRSSQKIGEFQLKPLQLIFMKMILIISEERDLKGITLSAKDVRLINVATKDRVVRNFQKEIDMKKFGRAVGILVEHSFDSSQWNTIEIDW